MRTPKELRSPEEAAVAELMREGLTETQARTLAKIAPMAGGSQQDGHCGAMPDVARPVPPARTRGRQ